MINNNKHIAFDIGNVLCHVDFTNFIKKLIDYQIFNNYNDAWKFLRTIQKQQDLGYFTMEDNLELVLNIDNKKLIDEIIFAWDQSISYEKLMIELIEELLYNDVKIALVSNMGYEHSNIIRNFFKFKFKNTYQNNINYFFSCDVGARKPNLLYYDIFLRMNPSFRECLYIDDDISNLKAASQFQLYARQ